MVPIKISSKICLMSTPSFLKGVIEKPYGTTISYQPTNSKPALYQPKAL